MPFVRPTLTALRTQAMQDITAGLPGGDGFLRRSVLQVLAWVQAGFAHLHYGYLDWISRQSVPFTCEDEFLDAWANLKGVVREPAISSSGTIVAVASSGTVTSGTPFLRSDGFQYQAASTAIASAGTVAVPIIASTAGSAGNAALGITLNMGSVVAGVSSTFTATTTIAGGADQETDDHLRTRMLLAYQQPPQGGAASDYVEWALAVPGVTRAWSNSLEYGDGSVSVYTMFDVTEAVHAGFPQGTNGTATLETLGTAVATGDQLTVANAIYPLRPVTALVYSKAPVGLPVAFTVAGLTPSTSTTQALVTQALTGLLYNKASPLADTPIDQSDADQAISAQAGITSFRVTAPSFPITPGVGTIYTLGSITFA